MNRIKMEMDAISENEGLARVCVAAFAARLDPTLEEINDLKTAEILIFETKTKVRIKIKNNPCKIKVEIKVP